MTSETRRKLRVFLAQIGCQQSNVSSDFISNGLPRAFSRESVWITLTDAEAKALDDILGDIVPNVSGSKPGVMSRSVAQSIIYDAVFEVLKGR
jgi:hypothetical protein